MSFLRNATRGLASAVLLLSLGGWVSAAELKENTADIKQDIKLPSMSVTIKRPGGETGCNTANHESWDTTKGGCSNTEYMKENAQVVSIASDEYRLSIGVIESTTLTANVRTKDGQPVGAGVPVTWSTSRGSLSAASSITNAASQAVVTLTTRKGTPKGPITIAAAAKGGGTSILVVVANSANISGLTATPPTALADGTEFITLRANVTYENGKSVGAGEDLTWDTQIGRYTYAETVTNTNGQAVAYLVSTAPGTAFASAIKDVAANAQVTFTAPVPVGPEIHSFAVKSKGSQNGIGSKYWMDDYVQFNGDMAWWQDNIFSWEASGADRYELSDEFGVVYYSGSDSEWHVNMKELIGSFGNKLYIYSKERIVFTLKAFKGSATATKTITPDAYWYYCGGGCSM